LEGENKQLKDVIEKNEKNIKENTKIDEENKNKINQLNQSINQ